MYYDSVRIETDNNSTPHCRGGMPRLVSVTDWFGATPNTGKLSAIKIRTHNGTGDRPFVFIVKWPHTITGKQTLLDIYATTLNKAALV